MKKFITIMAIIACTKTSYSQDVHFSQVLNNPLHINPAETGGYEGYERLVMNYRTQWSAANAPYNTLGFSFDMPLFQGIFKNKSHLGLGINFFSDKAGDAKMGSNQGNLSLAGIVKVDKNSKFVAGIQTGYAQRVVQLDKLRWATQFNGQEFDPTLPSYEGNMLASHGYMDFSGGLRYEYRNKSSHIKGFDVKYINLGVAMFHINQPNIKYHSGSNEQLYMKLVAHGSALFDIPNTELGVLPFFTFFKQATQQEINIGLMMRFDLTPGTKITGLLNESALYAGVQYRYGDAIIPTFEYRFTSFAVGLSYDMNISTLKTATNMRGGLEVSLKYHNLKGAIFKRRNNSRIYSE
jgi:type IX secretion system PorP/SprF family membrane protein